MKPFGAPYRWRILWDSGALGPAAGDRTSCYRLGPFGPPAREWFPQKVLALPTKAGPPKFHAKWRKAASAVTAYADDVYMAQIAA